MFNMYRRRFYARGGGHGYGGSEEQLGHDRFNYMNPNVNYDKWPRRLRPKKSSAKVELEAPESPHLTEDKTICQVRDCNGSLREHQRLLNLRAQRHKCSPRCRVKVSHLWRFGVIHRPVRTFVHHHRIQRTLKCSWCKFSSI